MLHVFFTPQMHLVWVASAVNSGCITEVWMHAHMLDACILEDIMQLVSLERHVYTCRGSSYFRKYCHEMVSCQTGGLRLARV